MNWLLKISNSAYFWTLCLICGLFAFLSKHFLITDNLYYASLGEQYTIDQIKEIINVGKDWQYWGYVIVPIVIIVRVSYTSLCLFIGDLVQEYHWSFKSLFNISLKADAVFILSQICNFYYYALSDNYKVMDDLNVNFLSVLKWTGTENIPEWLVFAYNSINVFELLYIIVLAIFIHASFKFSWLKSVIFMILTYGIGSYLYVVGMTFLYLNFV